MGNCNDGRSWLVCDVGIRKAGFTIMKEWFIRMLELMFTVISPALRKDIETWILQLEASAKKTENPWDDMFVAVLKSILLDK